MREGKARQGHGKPRQSKGSQGNGKAGLGQGKAEGAKGHGTPRQSKASLAMSCLALPGESLLSMERIRRLISFIKRMREGKA